jgi:hypothetical protein
MRPRAHRDGRATSDVCAHATVVVSLAADGNCFSTQRAPSTSSDRRYATVLLLMTDAPAVRSGQIHGPGSWFVAP